MQSEERIDDLKRRHRRSASILFRHAAPPGLERVPGVVWNPTLALHSIKRLKTLARLTGARVFPGHDPEFWRTVKQAPDAYR